VYNGDDLLLLSESRVIYRLWLIFVVKNWKKLHMKLNVVKSQAARTRKSHSKAVNDIAIGDKSTSYADELKYFGWYILSANVFRTSLHHMRVGFFPVF